MCLIGLKCDQLGPINIGANKTHPITLTASVTASGYIFRLTFRPLSDVSYSDECRTKKAFTYAKRMLPLFRAVVKFMA